MFRHAKLLAATAAGLTLLPATAAQAHVSFHPNAIPAGSFATLSIRVPNEEDSADITSVKMQLPDGVLSALGEPPAGWTFKAVTKKLPKPITTDDGTIDSSVTEIDFTGGHTPPGQMVNLQVAISLPDSAKAGDVVGFPTVQSYSNGHVARWIGPPTDEMPAPTLDITKAGTALLDVSGGDAGPPTKLPADLAGPSGSAAPAPAAAAPAAAPQTIIKKESAPKGLSVIALIVGALGLVVGGAALASRRKPA